MPERICLNCISELNKTYSFIQKVERTASTLNAYLEQFEDSEDEDRTTEELPSAQEIQESQEKEEIPISSQESQNEDYLVLKSDLETDQEIHFEIAEPEKEPITVLNGNNVILNESNNLKRGQADKSEKIFIIIQNEKGGTTTISENSGINENESLNSIIEVPEKSEENENLLTKVFFKCNYCPLEFVRKKNYENHMLRCTLRQDPEVPMKKLKLSEEPAETSLMEQQKDQLKQCQYCNSYFVDEKSLKIHESSKKCLQVAVDCEICRKSFASMENLTDHMSKEHTQKKSEESSRVNETVSDTGASSSKKYVCTICGRAFGMLSTLKDHVRYDCFVVSKGFAA